MAIFAKVALETAPKRSVGPAARIGDIDMIFVSDLMTDTVFTLQASDNLNDVRMLMKLAKVRHAPVTDDAGHFLGLITNRDLLSCTISRLAEIDQAVQDEIDAAILVRDVMQRQVITVSPGTLLKDAASQMYERKVGCLPVLEGRKLVGILTEADFIRLAISLLPEAGTKQAG